MHLDKNQKQQGLGLVKFVILIIFALVLIYVLYRVVNKKSAQLFSIPELYFHSHSKYFELLESDTKVKAATIMLSDLGYHKDWSYFRAFKGSEVYQPDKIHFHYHDINTLSDQEKEDLFLIVRNQRGFVRGISEDFDSSKNELAYHFYFHRQVLEKRTASELESYLTGSVIHHFLVVSPTTYSQELGRKHQLKISTLLEKKSLQLFEVVIKEMQASLVSRVFSTLIAPVYADECLGSLECLEQSFINCRCVRGGQVCLGNHDKDTCGSTDRCACDEVCDNPDYDPTRCAGYEAQATCLDAHNITKLSTLDIIMSVCWDGSVVYRIVPLDKEQAALLDVLVQVLSQLQRPHWLHPLLPSGDALPLALPPPALWHGRATPACAA